MTTVEYLYQLFDKNRNCWLNWKAFDSLEDAKAFAEKESGIRKYRIVKATISTTTELIEEVDGK